MNFNTIGIIGLGLIGGTLAKTIHRIYPEINIIACDTNEDSLKQAKCEGTITHSSAIITEDFSACRYIFLCAPVQKNDNYLNALAPYLSESCILSDTGSVKTGIHQKVEALGLSAYFIGGHPMAGSEKSGYEHSTAYLFENAYYIITHDSVKNELLMEYRDFIASLGCIPMIMNPTKHDYSAAAVSHLPHILASSLVNLVKNLDDEEETMKSIAAGGFKDITRIASSSPIMWQEICMENQEQLLQLINSFIESLEQTKQQITAKDSQKIHDFFSSARDYRDSLPIRKTSGSLPAIYELYCDLIDEAGGIATIATILAINGISIKNIGIIHNREFEDGVLRIEFYENNALEQAVIQLRKHHYLVYER